MAHRKANKQEDRYYIKAKNKFWRSLHEAGITGRQLKPREYRILGVKYGIYLTEIVDPNKHIINGDKNIEPACIRVPSKKVSDRFYLTYELKGAQKGVNVLTEYYRIPKMKIILDGRKVMKGYPCDYFEGIACFTRKGLNKRNVLHELYHHIVNNKGLEISEKREEREASRFVRKIMRKSW